MKKLTKKTLVSLVLTIIASVVIWAKAPHQIPEIKQDIHTPPIEYTDTNIVAIDSTHIKFVQEIDTFIRYNFPNSKLNGAHIADACIKHEFDPCFLLAQGIIESGLGTMGKAKRTGSPWNVGQHDGRSVQDMNKLGLTHKDPNHAIEPYIILVKTKYLGAKRTYDDLMRNYVTLSGHRYASNHSYEQKLRAAYKRIKSKTSIYDLYAQLINI